MRKFLCAVALLALCGCETPSAKTASRRPEITSSASVTELRRAVTKRAVSRGFVPQASDEVSLVFDGDASAAANFWFTNTLTGERPKVRVRYSIVDLGNERRVIARVFMVHDPVHATVETEMFNHNAEMQKALDEIKVAAEKPK